MKAASAFWLAIAGVGYAYLGYPAILRVLARLRRARWIARQAMVDRAVSLPLVTVVIAAYNEEASIAAKLVNTVELDYPPELLEVIVAADGSTDRTAEIAAGFGERVRVSYEPARRGKTAAIGRAVTAAAGDILVFSDANNMYERNALRNLVRPFADPRVGAVTGAKRIAVGDGSIGDAESTYWGYESRIKQLEWRVGTCTAVAGEILAVRRGLFSPPPPAIINDDFHIALGVLRRGFDIAYAPDAVSVERISPTAADEAARRARIVAGRYQAMQLALELLPLRRPLVAWQVISHKFSRPLVPLFMIGALVASAVAAVRPPPTARGLQAAVRLGRPYGRLSLAAQLVFYAVAWAGRRGAPEGRVSRYARLAYLPAFLVRSNIAALHGLARHLRGTQPASWQRVARRPQTGEQTVRARPRDD